jgi:DUF4097 and DUF4098 domain-containing protein YvlB
MKRSNLFILCAAWLLSTVAHAYAQEIPTDRLAVPFSDPSRPGFVKAGLINGGITVKGYEGKEVIVEARVRTSPDEEEQKQDRKKEGKAQGLRRIAITSTSLTVEEEENVVTIGVGSHSRTIDLTIQVPTKTSLKLSAINDGNIKVEQVEGEIEVSNTNGEVRLLNVSGTVVAHAFNGDLVVTMARVEADKSMSFTSFNGDVDVTLPATVRANAKMKTDHGDLFSDFDIRLEQKTQTYEEDARKKGGKYKIKIEKAMFGAINGGGPEFQFATYNGDIYIRKGK